MCQCRLDKVGFNTETSPETSLLKHSIFSLWSKISILFSLKSFHQITKWVSTYFSHIGRKNPTIKAMNLGPGFGRCRSLDCSTGTSHCGEMRSRGALISGWRRSTEKPNKIPLWYKKQKSSRFSRRNRHTRDMKRQYINYKMIQNM